MIQHAKARYAITTDRRTRYHGDISPESRKYTTANIRPAGGWRLWRNGFHVGGGRGQIYVLLSWKSLRCLPPMNIWNAFTRMEPVDDVNGKIFAKFQKYSPSFFIASWVSPLLSDNHFTWLLCVVLFIYFYNIEQYGNIWTNMIALNANVTRLLDTTRHMMYSIRSLNGGGNPIRTALSCLVCETTGFFLPKS